MDRNLQPAHPHILPPLAVSFGGKTLRGISNPHTLLIEGAVIRSDDTFDAVVAIQGAKIKQALAENATLKAEASNRAKSDFLTNMIHEIRTPVGAIIGLANILSTAQLDERQRQCLNMLQSCAEDLIHMISGSLDIDRIESHTINLDKAPFSMHALLQHIVGVISVMADKKNVRVTLVYDSKFSTLFVGDSGRIRQIVMNLAGNAIKFTETGSVTISFADSGEIDGINHISIAVTDTGIGIIPDKIDVVFERFVQADPSIICKFGGSGLGLSISKALAESMGGALTATSIAGKGSTFTLHLHLPIAHT